MMAIAMKKMKVMKKKNDGFEISETDLKLRGPGEFFGTRQHGVPQLKIANLYKDADILSQAQAAAKELNRNENWQKDDRYKPLKERINMLFNSDGRIGI